MLRAVALLAVGGLLCLGIGLRGALDPDGSPAWLAPVLLPLGAAMLAAAAALLARHRPRARTVRIVATAETRRGGRVEAAVRPRGPGGSALRAGLVCRRGDAGTAHEDWRDLHPHASEHALVFAVPADAPPTGEDTAWEVVVEADDGRGGVRRAAAAVHVLP